MIEKNTLDALYDIIEQLEVSNPDYKFMWLISDERASCILYYQTPTKEEDCTLEDELEVAFANNFGSFFRIDNERDYFLVVSHDDSGRIQEGVDVLDEVVKITETCYARTE